MVRKKKREIKFVYSEKLSSKGRKAKCETMSLKCQNKFSGTDNSCTLTQVIYQGSTIYKLTVFLSHNR